MPNHVHILIYPKQTQYDISKILRGIKFPVALRAISHFKKRSPNSLVAMEDIQSNGKRHYRFWQRGGGYDRNLISPDAIKSSIEYIHLNPVRKGLVTKADDWMWSSAGFFAGKQTYPLMMDVETLPF